jgi:hypothetical protein
MNPKKCTFGVSAGQFLGFLVHERGIKIGLKSQEAVRIMVPPTTKRELQQLIEQQWAFEEIKEYLSKPPVLVHPNKIDHSTCTYQSSISDINPQRRSKGRHWRISL